MLMGTVFPSSPDRLSPVGGQASSGYVPERLHPPPSRSTLSCGTTLLTLEVPIFVDSGQPFAAQAVLNAAVPTRARVTLRRGDELLI